MPDHSFRLRAVAPQAAALRAACLIVVVAFSCKGAPLSFFRAPDPSISFAVVGDIMGHQAQIQSAYDPATKSYDYKPVFAPLGDRISRVDFAIGNLELTLPGRDDLYSGYPQFGSPDALAVAIKEMGFDLLVTANNHSMDKGQHGVIRTIQVVKGLGFLQTGTFIKDEYEKNRILEVNKNGFKMIFLNYTYDTNGIAVTPGVVVNIIEKERILKDFELARARKPDIIIVLYHFGKEYQFAPDDYQKQWVNLAFEEGAQMVLGGHPHTLMPFERKVSTDRFGKSAERFVIYSLGNFVSNMQRMDVDGGIILNFDLRKTETGILIRKISYETVWVYTPIEKGRLKFYLVPLKERWNDPSIDISFRQRMKVFQEHADNIMKPGMPTIQDPPEE